jgi:hypothetical protein
MLSLIILWLVTSSLKFILLVEVLLLGLLHCACVAIVESSSVLSEMLLSSYIRSLGKLVDVAMLVTDHLISVLLYQYQLSF